MSNPSPSEKMLSESQKSVLEKGTILAQRLGTLRRYQTLMQNGRERLAVAMATAEHDSDREASRQSHSMTSTAYGAEAPIAFSISQLHRSGVILRMMKVDSGGKEVPGSSYTVGAFTAPTESPALEHDFTEADMQFAASQLKAQHAAGLSYVEFGEEERLFELLDKLA